MRLVDYLYSGGPGSGRHAEGLTQEAWQKTELTKTNRTQDAHDAAAKAHDSAAKAHREAASTSVGREAQEHVMRVANHRAQKEYHEAASRRIDRQGGFAVMNPGFQTARVKK